MSQYTSTMIDDELLIEELRRYGEKNLPTLPTTGTSSKASKKNQLNDTNRELYLKKLNHYKAREKAETNPSKHYSKTSRKSNNFQVKHELDQDDDVQVIETDNDIINLDSNETQYEYVKVSNAHTSPFSNYTQNFDDYNNESITTSSNMHTSPHEHSYQPKTNYVSLKDRIELDKTLSKYRSEINSILSASSIKNRKSTSSNLLNDDVIYTGSILSNEVSSSTDRLSNRPESQTLYCPKPKKSIFDSFRSKFSPKDSEKKNDDHNSYISRISSRSARSENFLLNQNKIKSESQTPKKEAEFSVNMKNFIHNKIIPFVSHLWIQLSKFLPYLVLIIFTIIALQYLRMKYSNDPASLFRSFFNTNSQKLNKQDSNSKKQNTKIEHFYCEDIKDTQCYQTKYLVRELIDYLRVKSGQIDCSPLVDSNASTDTYPSVDFIEKCVHLNKIINYLTNERKLIKNKQYKSEAIDSVLKAISRNPHWNIRLLSSSYENVNQLDQITYLMSTVSSKSFSCRFKELIHFLYVRVIMLASIMITLFLSYLIYKSFKQRRLEKDQKFFNLIKQVTELVEKQYELSILDSANIKPYIAISHVYDTLIEPSQRASNKKQWNEVIKFIEDHESRIHLETQFIDGEETLVWKWVVPKHHDSVNAFKYVNIQVNKNEGIGLANSTMINPDQMMAIQNKEALNNKENNSLEQNNFKPNPIGWQGDAFNKSEKLSHSPTPCLKIRGMFDQTCIDTDPLFSAKIHNDILQKCLNGKSNDSILHISCDKKSKEGCVYVKCLTNEAAGRVYQALNGTWYNGKLLNVKFLRSDRYLERFPESINFSIPLQFIKF